MTTIRATAPKTAPLPKAPAPALPGEDPNNHPGLQPDVIADRTQRGRIAEGTTGLLPDDVIKRGAPTYFRTYEQLKSAMVELQAKYPDLVKVSDVGDSYEKTAAKADRDIMMITLGNQKATGAKASSFHIGGVHAREIANPEMLMTFAKQLLDGYGRDPEATAMLNTRTINIVPMVNPDGHAVVERAYANEPGGNLMKRKNTSGTGGQGTDLNRNFEFHWGGAGASSSPASDTYRGASAASEPEVQAVQGQVKALKPNLFVDWHSYSKLNMYPWGDTKDKAPHYEGYKAVAEKMSTMNHYSPIQSIALYPTTGTSDDTAYGSYGVPALAVETGDTFHQSDQEFAKTLGDNLPVLNYLTKISDDPFNKVKGPDTLDVLVDPASKEIQARVTDQTNGKDPIAGAELVLDPYAAPGSGIVLTAADGAFDTMTETVGGTLKGAKGLKAGDGTLVYVRAKDVKGNWGPLTAQWLTGPAAPEAK